MRRSLASLVCLCLLLPRAVAAQDLERSRASVAEAALAGAGVVAVRGADALWINPAGLGTGWHVVAALGLERRERSVDLASPEVNVDPPPRARDLCGVGLIPSVAVALPIGAGITVGLGYHTGLYLHSDHLEGHPLRYLGRQLELRQHVVSLGIVFRWRWLAMGAAVELSHLRLASRRTLWAGLEQDRGDLRDPTRDLTAAFRGDDFEITGLFGLRLRPVRWLELGLAVRPPVATTLGGTLELRPASETPEPPAGHDAMDAHGGHAELELTLPLEVRGGLTLRPRRWLAVHLEARFSRWSSAGELALVSDDAAVVLSDNSPPIRSSVRPVGRIPLGVALGDRTSLHAGLELPALLGRLTLRAGYSYHLGATREAFPSGNLLDLDHHTLGLGAAAGHGPLRFAMAVQHCFQASMQTDGQQAVLVNPLDPGVTEPIGSGRFAGSLTRVLFSVGVVW